MVPPDGGGDGMERNGGGGDGMERNRGRVGLEDGGWRDKLASMGDADDADVSEEETRLCRAMRSIFEQNPPSERDSHLLLYNLYLIPLEIHLKTEVLPTLKGAEGESLLRQVVSSWQKHKKVVTLLCRFFISYKISEKAFFQLTALGLASFHNQVFLELKEQVTRTVLTIIGCERDGQPIDCVVLKKVLAAYSEVRLGDTDVYIAEFEMAFIKNSSEYYSKKAQLWILMESWNQYMVKTDQCLQSEIERIRHYLPASSGQKLIKVIQFELISRNTKQILQKMGRSGFKGFFCEKKVKALCRIFKFFCTKDDNLVSVSKIFKEHLLEELLSLVKEPVKATNCIKNEKELPWLVQNYVPKVAELHQKYVECVEKCFPRQPVFFKILRETFQNVCNKQIAGYTFAELLASFCSNMLRKYGSEKDLAKFTDATLGKVVKLLPYMTNKVIFVEIYRRNMTDTHEIAFLCKLRLYLGWEYSALIEEVQNDILLARQQKIAGALLGGTMTGATASGIDVQSFDLYLSAATKVYTHPDTKLSFNRVVEEFFMPRNGEIKKVKYTDEGYSIFGGLACLVTNAHAIGRSWDGVLHPNMFFQYQGQIHLFPWATPKFNCTPDTASNDLKAFGTMCLNGSSLRTCTGVVYPLHLDRLCDNLKKLPRGSAMGRSIRTYVRCHPSFLRHSQRSCVWWHIRRCFLSKKSTVQAKIRTMLDKVTSVKKQWFRAIRHHPLFASTFETAETKGMAYEKGAYGLYRFLRDWHTHFHQKTTAIQKTRYPFEVMEFVAELWFDHFLSDVLFNLLTEGVDIDVWLSELHPNLPVQNYKGG